MALIDVESDYKPDVISPTGDYGLMQINLCNQKKNLDYLDLRTNVTEGVQLLSPLLCKYETMEMALMAYNMGEAGAANLWSQGIYSSEYSRNIIDAYKSISLKSEYQ